MPRRVRDRVGSAAELRRGIEVAGQVGCGIVKLLDTPVHRGQSAGETAVEMGEWLLPLADLAAARGVTLVLENALYFRRAKDLWMLLESINHPAVGAAWDLRHGVEAGESPAVAVPTLNLRIRYARVAEVSGGVVEEFVRRLRGVGYGGYVTVGGGVLTEEGVARLRGWIAGGRGAGTKK
jgi:sugar phosphate isomerase/epimerase